LDIVFLPSLGADHRLLAPQVVHFDPLLRVVDWIEPRDHESLPSYAKRLASERSWPERFILGGVSFGGMVAYEIAQHVDPVAVVLVASCRDSRALALDLRTAALLSVLLPDFLMRSSQLVAPLLAHRFGAQLPWQSELLITMLRNADPRFVKWASRAVLQWHPRRAPRAPVYQIHGIDDHVIPASEVDTNLEIPGAGHLVNLTHPEAVNQFLDELLDTPRREAVGSL
jgi:pimeloyl-ACP methyl ester carboxylesterase